MIDFGCGVFLDVIRDDEDVKEQLLEWRNDYRVWRWCRQNDLIRPEDHHEWFHVHRKKEKMYLVGDPKDDRALGVAGLTSLDNVNRRAEFSLYIDPEIHGRGYGTKALQTLLNHGFRNLNMNCIWGETYAHNPATHMFEKVGLVKEGVRRDFYYREGRYRDAILYSMLKEEWMVQSWARV